MVPNAGALPVAGPASAAPVRRFALAYLVVIGVFAASPAWLAGVGLYQYLAGVEAAPRCGAASLIDKSIYAYISVFISNIT
jgi:hypothetical protein